MKGSKILLAVVVALALTGCGNSKKDNVKTLTCKTSTSGVDVDLKMDFKDDVLDDVDLTYSMDLSSYTDEQIEAVKGLDLCSQVGTSMGDLGAAFSNCKQDVANKKLTVKADIDTAKLSEEMSAELKDINAAKSGFESGGYTCTIK